MTIKELLVKVGFDVQGKEKLHGVEAQLEGIKKKLEFLTALEMARAVYELAERFAHFAEEIHIAAASAGITAEAFQKLAFAAQQNAVSHDEMSASMARLSRHLYDARRGGMEAAKVFSEAGFSPEQVQGFRTGSDVMLALADRFKNIQDPIKKQAIAMELMGRGSINMVGFLSKGSAAIRGMGDEAQRLGIVLSDQQVEALVEVEHSLQKLWGTIKGFSATIAALFGPSITFIIDRMLKFYEINHKILQGGIEAWAHKFAYAMGFIYGLIEHVVGIMIKFADSHRGLTKAVFTTITSISALATIALIAIKVFSLFHTTFTQAVTMFQTVGKIWEFIKALREWSVVTRIAASATSIWNAAMAVLGTEVAIVGAPVWAVVAAVTALALTLQAAYKWLYLGESFDSTWIGQIIDGVKEAIAWVGRLVVTLTEGVLPGALGAIKGGIGKIGGIFGIGNAEGTGKSTVLEEITKKNTMVEEMTNKAATLEDMKASPGNLAPAASAGNNSYSVNAPITVNVPPGSDHKEVSQSVKEGVKEHLDRVQREMSRSLRPQVSY